MPAWNDQAANLPDRETAIRNELNATSAPTLGHITFSQAGTLTVGSGALRWTCGWAQATIQGTVASVGTAPTGQSIICDVKLNGASIYVTSANRPTITAGTKATSVSPTPDNTEMFLGDYLTVDIVQIGSGTAGSDLVVEVLITILT